MCGFAGFIGFNNLSLMEAQNIVNNMGDKISHRGPDDSGSWIDEHAQIALTHRRLSILDLSPAGHQPMVSFSNRYVLVFNGEIYNHLDLRRQLHMEVQSGTFSWRGHSDTETLLSCIEIWGLEKTLQSSIGMFSLSLWDKQKRELVLARDRIGEKPLYYGWINNIFLFGSELKSLKTHPAFQAEIDRNALSLYMRHNYIPSPYSIYKGIYKLTPGTWLKIEADQRGSSLTPPRPYWSCFEVTNQNIKNSLNESEDKLIAGLDSLLHNVISKQMIADVPVGAFLSGGIDSSLIVALMQSQSTQPIKTFTIGFDNTAYNEAPFAKAIASYLKTDHTEFYVTPKQIIDLVPRLPQIYDEPFSDSSQIPTFLVAEMAHRNVKVSLSGDGGDELFGGYSHYFRAQTWWNRLYSCPQWFKKCLSYNLNKVSPASWHNIGKLLSLLSGKQSLPCNLEHHAFKLSSLLSATNYSSFYRPFVSHWLNPASFVLHAQEPVTSITKPPFELSSFFEQMMALDLISYLPDDILVKLDRAAMSNSLETRIPLLDHRVVDFAWRLPIHTKIRNGEGKWILRQLLYKYLPPSLVDRPKKGFGIPLAEWLRGPLREWAENLLSEHRLRQEGFFDPLIIRKKWLEHLSGQCNWHYHLWDILMFQAWIDETNNL
ncbi:MAG: asparagine synthase (glutamine-hydrolyzing) [Gammaproteobacteria bacterium]|jgi:asparagine synthase (glutamine-hydrolysing)|nr:asparagine synthase (glutamine-hydrolyzing) [Gammaproteobacteria bacterium]